MSDRKLSETFYLCHSEPASAGEESAVSTTLSPAFVIDELAAPPTLTYCHSEPASAVRNLLFPQLYLLHL